jgi:hypothetical protein
MKWMIHANHPSRSRKRKAQGRVLFMDQRQLLTFGYVEDVPLVPEYEKKVLMNAAMGADANYFAPFYADTGSSPLFLDH